MPVHNSRAPLRLSAAAILAAVTLFPLAATAAPDATGVWMNDTGRGAIEIKPCGNALCGHVVWVKDGSDAKGCGRQIIGDATRMGGSTWGNGWIYSPERKRRYDVEFKPIDDGKLRVIGFAGSKFFSKTMIWTRAPADLQRCGETTAAVEPAKGEVEATETAAPAPAKATAKAAAAKSDEAPAASGSAALNRTAAKAAQAEADEAAAAAAPAPAPAAGAETETTAADSADGEEQVASSGDAPDLGDLEGKLGKYLKRDGDTCKLNLPWVKVDFKCE